MADRHFNVAGDPVRERMLVVARELRDVGLVSAAHDLVGGRDRQRVGHRQRRRGRAGPDVLAGDQVVAALKTDGHRAGVEFARDDQIGLAGFRLSGLGGPDGAAPAARTDGGIERRGRPLGEDSGLVGIQEPRGHAAADFEARTAGFLRERRRSGHGDDRSEKGECNAHRISSKRFSG